MRRRKVRAAKFVGVVQVAREMGLARFGKLSVDGTKVRANASKRKAMSYERMGKEAARLQAEIEALLIADGLWVDLRRGKYDPIRQLPDLQEWVPPGHLAHHVSDVVDALDLTAFYAPDEGDGRRNAPYEPSMMVKVLIYAYATGTFSSRATAR